MSRVMQAVVIVRPAEAEPYLVLGRLLRGVVGKLRAAHRMHEHRQVVLDHPAGQAGGTPGALSGLPATLVNIWMPRAPSSFDRAIGLGERGLDVVHRHRGDEGWEMLRMLAADLGQQVVGEARELRRAVGRRDQLERRIGEAEHVLQAVELIEQPAARVDIDQRLQARKRRERRDVAGHELGQPIEIRPRHEVIGERR